MSKKRRKSREIDTISDSCQEPVASYKARFKKAKRHLKATLKLYREDGIDYNIQDEVVGRAYLRVVNTKRELEYRRRSR